MKKIFPPILCAILAGCFEPSPPLPLDPNAPRANARDPIFDAGKVVVGKEISHEFVIQNSGQSELVLGEWEPTETVFQCDISCEIDKRRIPPGGSAKARVTILPKEPSPKLRKGVYLETNDPAAPRLRIGFYAVVEPLLAFHSLVPQAYSEDTRWRLNTEINGDPEPFLAYLYSAGLEDFKIEKIETPPEYDCQFRELSQDELAVVEGRFGYEITTRFVAQEFVGTVRGEIIFHTNAPRDSTAQAKVFATRWGPVKLFVPPGSPWRWDDQNALFDVAPFPAAEGRTAAAKLAIRDADGEDWKIVSVRSDVEEIAVELAEIPTAENLKHRSFQLTLKIPPSSVQAVRLREDHANIWIETTHPQAKRIHLPFQYLSTR